MICWDGAFSEKKNKNQVALCVTKLELAHSTSSYWMCNHGGGAAEKLSSGGPSSAGRQKQTHRAWRILCITLNCVFRPFERGASHFS